MRKKRNVPEVAQENNDAIQVLAEDINRFTREEVRARAMEGKEEHPIFAIQYLEDEPRLAEMSPSQARSHLRLAFERLPISHVLIGWNLPPALLDACAEETTRGGACLFRWHPLLTGSGSFKLRKEWRCIGLDGHPVPGFGDKEEFTFACPNRQEVQEAVLQHLKEEIQGRPYQGIFLDRIRYPSPAADPARFLACFCEDCQKAAAKTGLDLEATREAICRLAQEPDRQIALLQALLKPREVGGATPAPEKSALETCLDFREQSITRMVRAAAEIAREQGLAVGLDCFSPSLAHMVGQDLSALDRAGCDWIKIMSYGHSLGPAGLPFEIRDLCRWAADRPGGHEQDTLQAISNLSGLAIPRTLDILRREGLPPKALAGEIQRARQSGVRRLLAGMELVEIEGITRLNQGQVKADLAAFRQAGADGLVLSWDLRFIPMERLDWVRDAWGD